MLEVKSLCKRYRGLPAIDNVSFRVGAGEIVGYVGPNGSGKSTTVKLMLGLLYPTKGQIQVFGHSPRHVATKARIGYLPQAFAEGVTIGCQATRQRFVDNDYASTRRRVVIIEIASSQERDADGLEIVHAHCVV